MMWHVHNSASSGGGDGAIWDVVLGLWEQSKLLKKTEGLHHKTNQKVV